MTAQVLGVNIDEFLDPIEEEEQNFEDLAKSASQEDCTAIRTQGTRNSPKVGNLRRVIYIPSDLAVEFINSTCTSAWETFELIAKRFVETTVDEDGNKVTRMKEFNLVQVCAILHWLAILDAAEVAETTL